MKLKSRVQDFVHSPHAKPRIAIPEFFDHQAATFEERAGLPADCSLEIARAALRIARVEEGDLVVELGPGTGQIGRWLCEHARYVGLDLSAGMLREFRKRLDEDIIEKALVQSDANGSWPLADATARMVFSSRAAHLLNDEHVARELYRVANPSGATLIVGRVKRDPQSVRARMAREMNARLRERGYEGRGGEKQNRMLFEACQRRGAQILEPITVARWEVSASPRQSLESWRSLKSLGGLPVPAETRASILSELEGWAIETFGGLDGECESEETYVLYTAQVTPR